MQNIEKEPPLVRDIRRPPELPRRLQRREPLYPPQEVHRARYAEQTQVRQAPQNALHLLALLNKERRVGVLPPERAVHRERVQLRERDDQPADVVDGVEHDRGHVERPQAGEREEVRERAQLDAGRGVVEREVHVDVDVVQRKRGHVWQSLQDVVQDESVPVVVLVAESTEG